MDKPPQKLSSPKQATERVGRSPKPKKVSPKAVLEPSDTREEFFERRQLFTVVRDVEVPEVSGLDETDGTFEPPTIRVVKSVIFMSWPDGTPCFEMDLYLMRLTSHLRFNSIRQEAVKLSHLVRYCWKARKNFWELRTSSFKTMVTELVNEKKINGNERRKANQINEISDSCVRFFLWMQKILLTHRSIVGLEFEPHQIELSEKQTSRNGRVFRSIHFTYNPPPNSRTKKTAMPQDAINRLWELVTSRLEKANKRLEDTHITPKGRLRLEVRRHEAERQLLMMFILQSVPVRPAEVCEMLVSENLKFIRTKQLLFNTKKREENASRVIKVPFVLTLRLKNYIMIYRRDFLDKLRSLGKEPSPENVLFLNEKGLPIQVASFTREFERLCRAANIEYRSCMSMFRHRAITALVSLHLKEYLAGADNERVQALILSDYSVVLARVAAVTGHKNPQSLRPYIDLAWDELGSFNSIDAAKTVVNLIQMILPDFRSRLKSASTAPKASERLRQSNEILEWLTAWEQEVKEALDAYSHYKVDPDSVRVYLP